jgi:asparagine synthase (glutamine-hydrolysing)
LAATPETPFNRGKSALYTADFGSKVRGEISHSPTREMFSRVAGKSHLSQMLYVDTNSWLPDDLLVKADKMTMSTSVELRVPLLDHQVLEFGASLPDQFKVEGKSCKRVLRLALQDSVPAEILTRKKAGFPLPYDQWLKSDLKEFVNDTMLSSTAGLKNYFKREELQKMLMRQQETSSQGKAQHALDFSREIFSLMVLELWHQEMGFRG